jgi:hypothetical protein
MMTRRQPGFALKALICAALPLAAASARPRFDPNKVGTVFVSPPRIPPVIGAQSCHGAIISGMAAEQQSLVGAQNSAIAYWTANAAQLVGPGYSTWANAKQQALTCGKGSTLNSHVCIARANPCKPI